jgi:hypothetical protein
MSRMMGLAVALLGVAVVIGGCGRPEPYHRQRPPVGDLDPRDRGLQSRDVIDATDTLVMRLLALPEFNQPERRTMIVTRIDNQTTNPRFNYDIFMQRLRSNLGAQGRDRIALLAGRQRHDELLREEMERPYDPFLQGEGTVGGPNGALQAEYALHGTIQELRGRGTSFYHFDFTVTNLRTREDIPLSWETRVAH